jgi:hypothetical protein
MRKTVAVRTLLAVGVERGGSEGDGCPISELIEGSLEGISTESLMCSFHATFHDEHMRMSLMNVESITLNCGILKALLARIYVRYVKTMKELRLQITPPNLQSA